MTNSQAVLEHYNHIYSSILSVYSIAVDTFFVMGALLLTISTLNALEKKKLIVLRMILHRYLRYTPVYAALILYIVSLAKFAADGPIQLPEVKDQCKQFWWSSLLHIQNYVNPNQPCAGHSW
jgi:peptidoglycan/LPS O-acetylase OafA/YrhL